MDSEMLSLNPYSTGCCSLTQMYGRNEYYSFSLNPYSTGCLLSDELPENHKQKSRCLNPYSTGCCSLTTLLGFLVRLYKVLILILLDVAL